MAEGVSAGKLAGPHVVRNWDDEVAGNYYVFDDFEFNVNVWWIGADGKLHWGRPVCLYAADELTGYVLGYIILVRPYTGLDVANLKLMVHDKWGVPRCGWKFENGIWRSRLADPEGSSEFLRLVLDGESWIKKAYGLDSSAFSRPKVMHYEVKNPKAKPVEGDFGIHQRLQKMWPGCVGANERKEKSDKLKEFEDQVRSGKKHPGEKWRSLYEHNGKFSKQIDDFHADPRGGRIAGSSPAARWVKDTQNQKKNFLKPEHRWILATNMGAARVTAKGIRIKIGAKSWCYASGDLGTFFGERVYYFINIENPGLLTICDRKRERFLSVESTELPANGATKDQIDAVKQRIAAYNAVPKMVADLINHPIVNTIAEFAPTGPVSGELGEQLAKSKEEHKKKHQPLKEARAKRHKVGDELISDALKKLVAKSKGEHVQ